jgi:hypothetical protein
MMALNERCPNAWHMLIERLIKKLIKSGEQVSKRYTSYLKVRKKIPYNKQRKRKFALGC